MTELINTLKTHAILSEVRTGDIEIFDHDFKGFGAYSSTCRVTIVRNITGYAMVILQDLGKGTSVTNASEQLATEIGKIRNLDPDKTIWLECYPYYGGDYDIDRIMYEYSGGIYSNPDWKPVKNSVIVDWVKRTVKP